ncbi:MAG TPA: transglycosylase SLT domain-containing protein [Chloroflexota bacterium]|nr:transglycosylase SLT domain-containing protein [Chloroflexota bacterium]
MTRALVLALLLLSLATPVWAQSDEEQEPIITDMVVDVAIAVDEVEPPPPPQEAPAPLARPLTIPELIDAAAYRWGVNAARLRCVAWRESTWRPDVTSPYGDRGLFQFQDSTWRWASWNAGVGGMSPYDPWAASQAAAWVVAHPLQGGGWGHWPTARWC